MNQAAFQALMPIISEDLLAFIVQKEKIPESEALPLLYNSKLYALLEDEETKLWYYSTPMLYSLLEQERETGTIVFPDV